MQKIEKICKYLKQYYQVLGCYFINYIILQGMLNCMTVVKTLFQKD
jgi:hypothetical protein